MSDRSQIRNGFEPFLIFHSNLLIFGGDGVLFESEQEGSSLRVDDRSQRTK